VISLSSKPQRRRGLILACGLVPTLLVAAITVFRPDALVRLDNAMYDVMVRSAALKPPAGEVVIVDIDERSLSAVGQWPWRRDVVARLVERLRVMGASVVALDVMFPETDRAHVGGGDDPDRTLASALQEGRVVLGYAMMFERRQHAQAPCVLHPVGVAVVQPEEEAAAVPFFNATGTICSLPQLAEAAGASGFMNAAPDPDGVLRRAPLLMQRDGRIYPGLALSAVVAARHVRDLSLRVVNANAAWLSLDDVLVPVDGRSNLLVRYRGKKQTFPYVSASDVLGGSVPDTDVRGKIVFVGTTALGTREVVATPLDTLFVGVEVQATVADNLLQQDFLRRHASSSVLELALVLGLAAVAALLLVWRGPLVAVLGSAGGLTLLWFGILRQVSTQGAFISPLCPALSVILALSAMTLATVVAERRRADTATREKSTAQQLMVQSLLSLTETRDEETGRHSFRTQEYTRLLACQLARHPAFKSYLTPARIELLSGLAPLHDIGKVGIPDHILNKPGALTAEELAQMRTHPVLGRDVIVKAEQQVGVRDDAILGMAKDLVYTHHERWDGSGYPQGLRGTEIPVPGRVLAIVDVYDALVERALYKKPLSHNEAVAFISKGRGSHFDPDVVDAFLHVEAEFKRLSGHA
jgi:CHASE2 domain-containing sensor protein